MIIIMPPLVSPSWVMCSCATLPCGWCAKVCHLTAGKMLTNVSFCQYCNTAESPIWRQFQEIALTRVAKVLNRSVPISTEKAIDKSVERAKQLAETSKPLAEHGTNQHSEKEEVVITTSIQDDRGAQYLTARIARDNPEILERMKRGEYRSVRAAAVDAGIVKPRIQFTASHLTNPQPGS